MDVFFVSNCGFGLCYLLYEVLVVGSKVVGVKLMNFKEDDYVVNGLLVYFEGDILIVIVI